MDAGRPTRGPCAWPTRRIARRTADPAGRWPSYASPAGSGRPCRRHRRGCRRDSGPSVPWSRARRGSSTSVTVCPAARRLSAVRSTAARTRGSSGSAFVAAAALNDIPIRSGAGSVAAASTSDSANVPNVSRNSALSVTRPARQPCVDRSCQPPELGIVPWVGLNPTSPQHAAGMRIDPAPSDAVAMPTAPAATSAAEPPDEPPVVCARFMRVAGDAVRLGLGEAEDRELGQGRLGDDDHAGGPHRRDEIGVLVRRHEHGAAALAGDRAPDVEVVLDRDRDAQQRPGLARRATPIRVVGGRQRLVGVDRDGRVDRRVVPADRVERGLGQLARRQRCRRPAARPDGSVRRRRRRRDSCRERSHLWARKQSRHQES